MLGKVQTLPRITLRITRDYSRLLRRAMRYHRSGTPQFRLSYLLPPYRIACSISSGSVSTGKRPARTALWNVSKSVSTWSA
jgi:hypothetical protein